MRAGNFRVVPLDFADEEIRAFLLSVRSVELSVVQKTIALDLFQLSHPLGLGPIWRCLNEKISLQIDGFTHRAESLFSIIALECEAINHTFRLTNEVTADNECCSHQIVMKYRTQIRIGPNGDLKYCENDKVSDADRMLAKLLFKSPHEDFH